MASVHIFLICLVGCIVAPVASQLDIVSVKTIEDGSPFTILCSAQQVITPSANFSSVYSLQIHVMSNGAKNYTLLAQYVSLVPPSVKKELQAAPAGRNWKFSFNGSNEGDNNQRSMRIEILVSDGKCEDAGVYKCTMVFYSLSGISTTVFSEQNVSSTARTSEPRIVLDPIYEAPQGIFNTSTYDIGANITVTCRFEGPEQLDFKWKRERRPAIGIDILYDDYQAANDITTDLPTKATTISTTCPQYSHKSVLRLTIAQEDADRRYLCVIVSGEEEKASSAAFIQVGSEILGPNGPGTGTGPEGDAGAASAGKKPDHTGLIAGVVVGVVVAIIIVVVIVVVCYRRRSKGGNKNDEDSPDGGHIQQAPPPVLYSRPNKGVNNNSSNRDSKVSTGRINEGLNNSYDSRDSAHKGPPVYAITGPREPYQGRQNRGFDTEVKSSNSPPRQPEPPYYNYETRPPVRRYSTDDNTDVHRDYYEDADFGTGV